VIVHVYDVPGFEEHNDSIMGWFRFGVFHVEVQIHEINYAFVANSPPEAGSLWVPGQILSGPAPHCVLKGNRWRWTGVVGTTEWTGSDVPIEVEGMRQSWKEYNLFHANCQDFAADFVSRASCGRAGLPTWVRNAAQNLAKRLTPPCDLSTRNVAGKLHGLGCNVTSVADANSNSHFTEATDMEPDVVRALAECKLQLLELLHEEVPGHESSMHALALLIQLVRWGKENPPKGALDIPDCLLQPFIKTVSDVVQPGDLSINVVDHLPALCEAADPGTSLCLDSKGLAPRMRLAWAALAISSRCCFASHEFLSNCPPPHLANAQDGAVLAWRAIAWPNSCSESSLFAPPPLKGWLESFWQGA